MRIQKYISKCGICSRREAETKILEGLVTVNGKPAEIGQDVNPETDRVWVDGRVARGAVKEKVVLAMNKPKGYLCSNSDPFEAQTVFDLLPEPYSKMKLFCCGRLDKGSRGLLILTNDGDLASKLTHPKFIKKKIYHVWLDKDINEDDMQRIADGVELEDGLIQPDAVSYATETDKNQVGIEIHSGRNRIVRRIFEALGYHVTKLDRVYFAGLTKKNLPRGRWRYLTQEEVNMLNMGSFE